MADFDQQKNLDQNNKTYAEFWKWFSDHAQEFYEVIKSGQNVEENFINIFAPELDKIESQVFFLVGMEEDKKAELIFTPDGRIQNVFWAEKLVAEAPEIDNWKFRALKPASQNIDFAIKMHDLTFDRENIQFYPILHENYPDKIDLMFVYNAYHEEAHDDILNGIFIFLDNFLGEETMIQSIDKINVKGPQSVTEELIPLEKLKDYIIWREKEFVEKYQDVRHDPSNDEFTGFEGTVEGNKPILSTFNTSILNWEYKASHPWILVIMIHYTPEGEAGFPDAETYKVITAFEDDLELTLPSLSGYIFLGSETVDGLRETFIACREFRLATEAIHNLQVKYKDTLDMNYEFYKDKYWQSFERYKMD